MCHAFLGDRAGPYEPILRLEEYVDASGNVVGDQRRYADTQIYEHAAAELFGNSFGDDRLSIHRDHLFATM
jgi:hypothetical protein